MCKYYTTLELIRKIDEKDIDTNICTHSAIKNSHYSYKNKCFKRKLIVPK